MPRDTSSRKKWTAQETTLKVQVEDTPGVHDEPSAHEEYLILLQEKNRLVKQLKKKDERQLELEKREAGFSLYVNGPDTRHRGAGTARTRHTKTAGNSRLQRLNRDLEHLETEKEASKYRSQTAPNNPRRKNWQAGSINLKTHRGEKIRIKAPDILTGEYADDFEVDSVEFAEDSGSERSPDGSSDSGSESGRDREGVARAMQRHVDRASRGRGGAREEARGKDKDSEMLTLTIDDVKKLRQSLEMNASIRESMAYCSSDSESDGGAVSPVEEEDEVEEAIGSSSSSEDVGLKPIKDRDKVVVLELNSNRKERSERRMVGVPRRADADAYGALKTSPGESSRQQGSTRGQQVSPPGGNKDIVLKPDGAPRRGSRPLSANRKSQNPMQDSTTEAESVLAALRAENESVLSGRDTERRRGTQSAPGRPQGDEEYGEEFGSDTESPAARPATTTTGWKDRGKPPSPGQPGHGESRECWPSRGGRPEQNIDHIVQKVLQLDMRGQKRLLKALAHIEDGTATKTSPDGKYRKKPLKATKPVNKMVRGEEAPAADMVEVMVELLSSWGHPSRVGLTEIQFYDIHKQRIYVNPANIKVQGATSTRGDLTALFNAKTKTTKERNMWSCAFSNSRRVRLSVTLHSVAQGQPLDLSKIKIWNYNKSLNDLKEGACHIRIMLDNEVVYDGELDKGCGNQVFDYGMSVMVRDAETTPRSADQPPTPADSGVGTGSGGTSAHGGDVGGLGGTLSHMENVLFHSEDFSDHSSHSSVPPLNLPPPSPPVRSETRIMNHSADRAISLPVVDTPHGAPPAPTHSQRTPDSHRADKTRSRSHSRDHKEEESGIMQTPRSPAVRRKKLEQQASMEDEEQQGSGDNDTDTPRRSSKKKKKERKSKMAARLDGSGSSVELSMMKESMDRQDSNGDLSSHIRTPPPPPPPHKHHRSSTNHNDRNKLEESPPAIYDWNRNNNHNDSRYKGSGNHSDQGSDKPQSHSRSDSSPKDTREGSAERRGAQRGGGHMSRSQDDTRQSQSNEGRPPVRPRSGRMSKEGIPMSPRLHSPRRASLERRPNSGLSRSESMRENRPSSGQKDNVDSSQPVRQSSTRVSRSVSMREGSRPSSGKYRNLSAERPSSGNSSNLQDRPSSGRSSDRPSSGRSSDRPSSGRSSDRPSSGRGAERSSSGREADRPSSGREADRPSSGREADRPSSGREADRPSSGREADRPSSGTSTNQTSQRPSSKQKPIIEKGSRTDKPQKEKTNSQDVKPEIPAKKNRLEKPGKADHSGSKSSVKEHSRSKSSVKDKPEPSGSKSKSKVQKETKADTKNKKGASEKAAPAGATSGVVTINEPSEQNSSQATTRPKPVGEPGRLAAEESSFRSHSPYMSDEETCMMNELSKMKKELNNKKNFPAWLDKTGQIKESPEDGIIDDDDLVEDEDLLENWPKSGLSHLPTVLDDGTKRADRPASGKRTDRPSSGKRPHSGRRADRPSSGRNGEPPTHGRRSRQGQGQTTPRLSSPDSDSDTSVYLADQVADDAEEEAYRRQTSGQMASEAELADLDAVPRMKQIESARAQWRKQEQNRLEESWSSLNIFERSKGRLSVDMEKDILDEYLNHEPQRPHQPTIEEEATEENQEEESFTIPELPKGREMVFNIKTTWGDRHYVGLNGIEIFTSSGEPVKVVKIRADPADINVLNEYNKDPRVVTNLIDCVNRTRDDVHMWLAPYVMGQDHKIMLTFDQPHTLAMMRIWNYNKSRIHSYRGAKDIEVMLDGVPVFKGEIARACGGVLGGSEAFGDTILFTMDEDILEEVSRHDTAFEADALMDFDTEEEADRPATADRETERTLRPAHSERPFTCAARRGVAPPGTTGDVMEDIDDVDESTQGEAFCGQDLCLNFTATWGDVYYLGLTGLEVVGADGEPLPVTLDIMDADPRDLHVLPGYEQDDRTLDKLVNNINITTCDENMWLIPYTEGEDHWLRFHFTQPMHIAGLRFWNYNKSPEDTYRGAKIVHVTLDGKPMSPQDGFLIRKGPGNCYFDFAQEVSFAQALKNPSMGRLVEPSNLPRESVNLDEEYEAAQVPCGFIYQLQLMSSWGDPYYIGLNGLEFYDIEGNLIKLTENNISAYPDSVNVLDGVEGDVRTPDKLINGINATQDGKSMWLAPILPGLLNKIYVIFDQPMQISMIKLWNYSKTANRGVKDFALLVDDLLVYNGILKQVVPAARGILPTCDVPQTYHTILFSDDSELRRKEKHTIILNQTGEQDVQLTNDHQLVNRYTDPRAAHATKAPDQALRPKTSMIDRSKGPRR